MKRFVLKMPAYHFLERNHYVSITEAGDLVTNTNSRVRYYITLDKKRLVWIYYRYLNCRNDFYEFELSSKHNLCSVFAGFSQVSSFNYK